MAELWTCPKCGRPFANRNQAHSCVVVTVDEHFAGKPAEVRELFDGFVALARRNGPVSLAPVRSRIGLQVRIIFAAAYVRRDHLKAHVLLPKTLEHPRIEQVEEIQPYHVHYFRIRSVRELDDEVAAWLAEAYRIGRQDLA